MDRSWEADACKEDFSQMCKNQAVSLCKLQAVCCQSPIQESMESVLHPSNALCRPPSLSVDNIIDPLKL